MKEENIKKTVDVIVRALVELFAVPQTVPEAVSPAVVEEWMTRKEYAAYRKVGATTVYRWMQRGLPVSDTGGIRRINVVKADAWIVAGGLTRRKTKAKRNE